jgi:TolA-binding protein
MKKIILVFCLIGNVLGAEIIPVKRGDVVPGDGYYITPKQEKRFRQINEERKQLQGLEDLQIQKEIEIASLNDRLEETEKSSRKQTIYMVIGMALATGITWAATRR